MKIVIIGVLVALSLIAMSGLEAMDTELSEQEVIEISARIIANDRAVLNDFCSPPDTDMVAEFCEDLGLINN